MVGLLLLIVESYWSMTQTDPVGLVFEDLLLGSSAICMLFEEVRLLMSTRDRRSEISTAHSQLMEQQKKLIAEHKVIQSKLNRIGPEVLKTVNAIFQTKDG